MDYLSLNYAILLTFAAANHPLLPIVKNINKQKNQNNTAYSSLYYPLKLLYKIIPTDCKLED